MFRIIRLSAIYSLRNERSSLDSLANRIPLPNLTQITRNKYNKGSKTIENDSDSDEDADGGLANDKSLMKTTVNSLRTDVLIKAGLGLARNKVETKFYENKIRVNGTKVSKKSAQLEVGDEVDVIKGTSPQNTDHLIVGRIEVVSATPKEENISVVLRRFKSLIIENYPGTNAWKGSSETD